VHDFSQERHRASNLSRRTTSAAPTVWHHSPECAIVLNSDSSLSLIDFNTSLQFDSEHVFLLSEVTSLGRRPSWNALVPSPAPWTPSTGSRDRTRDLLGQFPCLPCEPDVEPVPHRKRQSKNEGWDTSVSRREMACFSACSEDLASNFSFQFACAG
jgi:hypothetical protein